MSQDFEVYPEEGKVDNEGHENQSNRTGSKMPPEVFLYNK